MGEIQRQFDQHNYRLNLLEGVLFISTTAFTSLQIVIPALVLRLGGGNVLVGALPVIVYVGLFFPQIFAARYAETMPWKRQWTIRAGSVQRTFVLVMAVVVMTLGGSYPAAALTLFLVSYFLMHVSAGITTPGWYDFYAKLTPLKRRGRLSGMRTSLGSLAAFVAGFLLTLFLAEFAFPFNYGIGFVLAYLLQMASTWTQTRMIEAEPSTTVSHRTLRGYLAGTGKIFVENPEFKRFLISAVFLIIANVPAGFFTVYALKRFSVGESIVGEFIVTMMFAQVVAAAVSGIIADHYGNRRVLLISATGMLLASLWALLAPTAGWFRLVFLFLGINVGTELMARYNIAIEYGPPDQRSRYIALMNTALAPVYLAGLFGGWLSDLFGYHALFGAGMGFSLLGLLLLVRKVKDPRIKIVMSQPKPVLVEPAAGALKPATPREQTGG